MACVVAVEDLDPVANVEEVALVGGASEAEGEVGLGELRMEAALARAGLEGAFEPFELPLLQGSSFSYSEPQLSQY